ncbi:MAG: hypothetical protein Q7S27_04970 [Nanoarchaeota archaeon]|nr:hypothetical protein [Nanoarchaeota archaeon]
MKNINSSLSLIVDRANIALTIKTEEEKDAFHYSLYFNYNNKPVRLSLSVLNNGKSKKYQVCVKPQSPKSNVEFLDLEKFETNNRVDALYHFELYLSFAQRQSIPKEWLPSYRKWERIHRLNLSKPAKEPHQSNKTLEEYLLKDKGGIRLNAKRKSYKTNKEFTSLYFNSPFAEELISIHNGKILQSSSNDHYQKKLRAYPIRFITYYLSELRELPWQDDIKALTIKR